MAIDLEEQSSWRKALPVAAELSEDVKARPIVAQGTVYKIVIDTAEGIGADLIVMASHRPERRDYTVRRQLRTCGASFR